MNLHSSIALLTVMTVISYFPAKAQDIDENNFTLYTRQQGLSGNLVTGMVQDSTGFIWTSTFSGLNRFNGSNFVQFHSDNDSLSLPSEYIKGIIQLDKRRIASIGDGLNIVDTYTGKVRNLFIPYSLKKYQYKFNWIMAINCNDDGDLFIVARSGFYHYNKAYQLVFRYDHYLNTQVPTSPFEFGRYLFMLDQKHLVIVSDRGLFYYDANQRLFKRMNNDDCPLLNHFLNYPNVDYQFYQQKPGCVFILKSDADSIWHIDFDTKKVSIGLLPFLARKEFDYRSSIAVMNDSLFYITGRYSGFYKIEQSRNSGKIKFFNRKYFSSYSCRSILKDRDGDLWIATKTGLLHEVKNRTFVTRIDVPNSLLNSFPNFNMGDLFTTNSYLIVATTGVGPGLLVFDKKDHQFIRRIGLKNCYRHPEDILAIAPLSQNSLLIGSNGPLFKLNLQNDQIREVSLSQWDRVNDWIADICTDRNNNIWISSGNLYHYNPRQNKTTLVPIPANDLQKIEWTRHIQTDTSGNIWLAGHGLLRYNIHSGKIDRYLDSFPYIKIPDQQVNSFIADDQNNLWINANNNGLICYNIDRQTFRQFTRDNGLPENNIADMLTLNGKLWLATYSGICCLDIKTFTITSFGKEEGFPDQPVTKGSHFYYDSETNRLYIGFTNTLLEIDPQIADQKLTPPQLFIESFVTDHTEIFLPQSNDFTTKWYNNEIKITIGSINYNSSSTQRFAFRLTNNNNPSWQELGNRNTFYISNLTPGHHSVQVKLYSCGNRWPSQIREFDIVVIPPFWAKSWFYYLEVLFIIALIYLLVKWRISMIRKKEQEKTHIQKLKAEEYKIQFELEQISNYFSSSLADKKNVEEVLWDVSKNLIGRMNYEDCMIYMWNEEHTKMIQKASYGPKGTPSAISSSIFDVLPGQGVVGHVMLTKEPLIISDTRLDNRYRVDDIIRLSEICVPIIDNDKLIGIIDSEHSEAGHFNGRDIKILTTIATLVSNKIRQIETEHSLLIKQKEIFSINQQLAEAQLLALQTQMNPHFLFNSLNGIKGMILENEQQRASRYITKFANLLRITLNQSKEAFTTLCENMEQLENYLTMEKLRFDDSFTFRITSDKYIDQEDTLIPTMMLQPLAENAIWHGLMPKKGSKKLLIHFSIKQEILYCTVEDNGIGLHHSEQLHKLKRPLHESLGLANLRNRIKILNEKYNTGCNLDLIDLHDIYDERTGSCAILSFKLITNHSTYESHIN
jgi:ligand-binding sensor domain-containing protein/putative methionine-R-sulfoxide reductase with GAF domain